MLTNISFTRSYLRIVRSFLLILSFCFFAGAQNYHKTLRNAEDLFTQRILRLDDGGFFIGDSFLTNGEIFISRFFKCGEVDWSYRFKIQGAFTEFRDFVTTSAGDLVVFGSYFVGNQELIFIQKINPENGMQISFDTFDPIFQDHITFSIDILGGEIMIYGLLLDFNTERRGFLAVLDESTNIKWVKHFTPFEKEGQAIIASDGYYTRSAGYHVKFDSQGEIIWAKNLDVGADEVSPIGGPFKVNNGNIYEATLNNQNFFYKLDEAGNLLWQSDLFATTSVRSDLNELSQGNLIVTYYGVVNGNTVLSQMTLNENGVLNNQKFLSTDKSFASGAVQASLFEDLTTIVGSPEPFTNFQNSHQDFLVQLDSSTDLICASFQQYNDLAVNNLNLNFTDFTFDVLSLGLEKIPSRTVSFDTYEIGFSDVCSDVPVPEVVEERFQLQCGSNIDLDLPTEDFLWDDLHTSEDRTVSEPGIYKARSIDCDNTMVLIFTVESPDCECKIFFPSALSPNQDGFNDQLEYFSDCKINAVNYSVYNRWGERIYKNNIVGQFWQAENVISGVYILQGSYQVVGPNGSVTENEFSQSVTVLR